MARKSPKDLDTDIDAYLRHERIGPRESRPAPKFSPKKGGWTGGDTRTLYAFTHAPTGRVNVYPGQGANGTITLGPAVTVRVASRAEAERHWQNPLHAGWTVTA